MTSQERSSCSKGRSKHALGSLLFPTKQKGWAAIFPSFTCLYPCPFHLFHVSSIHIQSPGSVFLYFLTRAFGLLMLELQCFQFLLMVKGLQKLILKSTAKQNKLNKTVSHGKILSFRNGNIFWPCCGF